MDEMIFEKLKNSMKMGIISFTYKKLNGEMRDAKGTLNMKYIEERGGLPNGNGIDGPSDILRYWDVNSDGWRSCKINNIISYTEPNAEQKTVEF